MFIFTDLGKLFRREVDEVPAEVLLEPRGGGSHPILHQPRAARAATFFNGSSSLYVSFQFRN